MRSVYICKGIFIGFAFRIVFLLLRRRSLFPPLNGCFEVAMMSMKTAVPCELFLFLDLDLN